MAEKKTFQITELKGGGVGTPKNGARAYPRSPIPKEKKKNVLILEPMGSGGTKHGRVAR